MPQHPSSSLVNFIYTAVSLVIEGIERLASFFALLGGMGRWVTLLCAKEMCMRHSPSFVDRVSFKLLLLVSLFLTLLLCGCASKFEKALDDVHTGDEAERRFGAPSKTEKLADGSLRREWLLYTPPYSRGSAGGDSAFQVSVGSAGSGVGVWLSKMFWPDSGSYSERYCRLEIVTDEQGGVIQKRWQGDDCERLLWEP